MEDAPAVMLAVLGACGALVKVLPELAPHQPDAPNIAALGRAALLKLSLPARFAALAGTLDEPRLAVFVARARVPNDCRDLAQLYVRHGAALARAAQLDAAALAEMILNGDGLRQEARFLSLIAVAHVYATEGAIAQPGGQPTTQSPTESASQAAAQTTLQSPAKAAAKRLTLALSAARGVDAGSIAKQHTDPQAISAAVKAARVAAIAQAIAAS